MRSRCVSHLGCMAKNTFFIPGKVLTSSRRALGPKGRSSLSWTGTPFTRNWVQPIDGHSTPASPSGLSSMCLYDLIMSKGTLPSKENTKLPLLRGLMLQRPARRCIGLAVALAIFSLTSRTIASAARFQICSSLCMSVRPPAQRTITSMIVGGEVAFFLSGGGCGRLVAVVAAPAYEVGVGAACLICSDAGTAAFTFPLAPLPFPMWETIVKLPSVWVIGLGCGGVPPYWVGCSLERGW